MEIFFYHYYLQKGFNDEFLSQLGGVRKQFYVASMQTQLEIENLNEKED